MNAALRLKPAIAWALLAGWTCLLLANAAPTWFPDPRTLVNLSRSFLSRDASGAGILYALFHHGSHAAVVCVLHLVLAGAGAGIMRFVHPGFTPGWLTAWGAGFGAVSLLTFALGLAGLMEPLPVIALSVLAALAGVTRWTAGRFRRLQPFPGRVGPAEVFVLALAGAALLVLGALAVAPDTSWDSVVYHLRVPSFFIQEHRVFYMPANHFTAFPLACEMLYSWLMLWGDLDWTGGGQGAKLFHLSCACIAAISARRLVLLACPRRRFAAGLALALVLVNPFTGTIAVRAYNDFVQAALAGLILVVLVEGKPGGLRAAGVLAGVALSAKYTAVLFLAPLAVLWLGLRPVPYLLAAVGLLPWVLKNWLLTGNPAAPFLNGLFPSGPESQHQLSSYAASVAGMSVNPAHFGRAIWELAKGRAGEFLTELLPVLMAAFLVIPGEDDSRRKRLAIFTGVLVLLWLVISPAIRFLTPAFAPLAVLAAIGYARLEAKLGTEWPRPLIGILLFLSLVRLPIAHCQLFDPLPFTFGRETVWDNATRSLYPSGHFGRIARWANRELPPGARLLCLIDIKAHYVWRRTYHDFQYVQPGLFLRWLREAGSVQGLLKRLKREGIGYLLIVYQSTRDVGRHYSWKGDEMAQAAEFLAAHTESLAGTEKTEVLAVVPQRSGRRQLGRYGWMLFMHPENLMFEGRDTEARSLLEATMKAAPWLPGVKSYLGIACARLERYAEAEKYLAAGVAEGGPQAAEASYVLGRVRIVRGDEKGGEAAWRAAVKLDPKMALAHHTLGLLLVKSGRRREGVEHLASACRLEPGNEEFRRALADNRPEGGVSGQ